LIRVEGQRGNLRFILPLTLEVTTQMGYGFIMIPKKIVESRFGLLFLFFCIFIVLSFITRTILLVKAWSFLNLTAWLLMKIYGMGLFYDAITMICLAIPLVLYLFFIPDKIFRNKFHKPFIYFFSFVTIYLLLFDGVAEYFFFDEFGVRFNFIAIDYLIYTRELINNMKESYPLLPLFLGMAFASLFILLLVKKKMDQSMTSPSHFSHRLKYGLTFLLLPFVSLFFVNASPIHISSNAYANELSANGIYNLFAAFRSNEINYETFYATLDHQKAFQQLRTLLQEKNNAFANKDMFDIDREIKPAQKEKQLNIALIIVESLSAEYLGVFGNKGNLTPNLDQLAKESLFLTNMHATGTRTDRGLESIILSVPPTPGRSIVKRPENQNMFSWGFLMKERGYDTKFIYSGYGYFDNMNYFFSHNGFDTIDRTDFSKNEIRFENAWGVSDEDLFHKAINEFDKSFDKKSPFFAVLLTTSNHRPFTYPDGRIDIPSHTGRGGAVKYTDFAIGKFMRDAREKPWYKDTLFVIVADHCANSAGKTTLPVKRYEIPFFIYSPAHITPQKIDILTSQIDIAPTILGILNVSYRSKFFGKDILKMEPEQGRAFIGTYEKLGYMKNDKLVVLNIKKEKTLYRFDRTTGEEQKIQADQNLFDEAISIFQGGYYLYQHHLNRWDFGKKDKP
jgi:phosphoglycerol transferase MdoB-like AlkP superfamily enzyme